MRRRTSLRAPRRAGVRARGRRSPSSMPAPEGGALRDRPAPRRPPPPSRRRPRRSRPAERRRRAARDPREARRLPRRQPVHDLGLQVRPARGGASSCGAGPGRDARSRSRKRRWALLADASGAPSATPRTPSCFAALREEIEPSLTPAPARGAGRGHAQRGADRRPRRAAGHHPRRPLQDPARRRRKLRARARRSRTGARRPREEEP